MSITETQLRVPRGRPTGGEFAARQRNDSDVSLTGHSFGVSELERASRARALELGGYVPARAVLTDPGSTATQWWERAYAAAEYQADGSGFAKLTDDYAAAGRGGSRVRRMTYDGAGVRLRMPSASLIRAFADDHPGETFDIPVEGTYPGGDAHGWVRVTRHGPAEWSVQGIGMDDKSAAYVSEAVSAVMEARSPRAGLREIADLMVRRRARFAASGVRANPTQRSGFISGVGYNRDAGVMSVRIGDRHYGYSVPEDVFNRVRGAKSPGQAYNILVKGNLRSEPITSCDRCGRFYAEASVHRCPSKHHEPTDSVKRSNLRARALARL